MSDSTQAVTWASEQALKQASQRREAGLQGRNTKLTEENDRLKREIRLLLLAEHRVADLAKVNEKVDIVDRKLDELKQLICTRRKRKADTADGVAEKKHKWSVKDATPPEPTTAPAKIPPMKLILAEAAPNKKKATQKKKKAASKNSVQESNTGPAEQGSSGLQKAVQGSVPPDAAHLIATTATAATKPTNTPAKGKQPKGPVNPAWRNTVENGRCYLVNYIPKGPQMVGISGTGGQQTTTGSVSGGTPRGSTQVLLTPLHVNTGTMYSSLRPGHPQQNNLLVMMPPATSTRVEPLAPPMDLNGPPKDTTQDADAMLARAVGNFRTSVDADFVDSLTADELAMADLGDGLDQDYGGSGSGSNTGGNP